MPVRTAATRISRTAATLALVAWPAITLPGQLPATEGTPPIPTFDKTETMVADARRREAAHEHLRPTRLRRQSPDHHDPHAVRHRGRPTRRSRGSYAELARDGYIFVHQDIRGRYKSEGQFVMLRQMRDKKDPKAIDESTDTYDTIDWLIKNVPHNNGRVGMMGVSYPGLAHRRRDARSASGAQGRVSAGVAGRHVHRRRLPPQRRVPVELRVRVRRDDGDRTRSVRRSRSTTPTRTTGISSSDRWPTSTRRTCTGTSRAGTTSRTHPNYDSFWQRQAVAPYVDRVTVPTLSVPGWWDQEDFYGPITIYELLEKYDTKNLNYPRRRPVESRRLERRRAADKLGNIDFGSRDVARLSPRRCSRRCSPIG